MTIKSNSSGFTLAEVLITLGIIGVIAALTLPNLITQYQKKRNCSRFESCIFLAFSGCSKVRK